MDKNEKFKAIKRKTRQRIVFSLITMALYFSFVLNYTSGGSSLIEALGSAHIPGALVMFAGLIIVFVILELVFLFISRERSSNG
jgi:uncharacterized membrane protein (DUF485 family)